MINGQMDTGGGAGASILGAFGAGGAFIFGAGGGATLGGGGVFGMGGGAAAGIFGIEEAPNFPAPPPAAGICPASASSADVNF